MQLQARRQALHILVIAVVCRADYFMLFKAVDVYAAVLRVDKSAVSSAAFGVTSQNLALKP